MEKKVTQRDRVDETKPKNVRSNILGQTFGRLYVDSIASEEYTKNGRFLQYRYLCKCKCGGEKIVPANSLKSGRTNSCGCLHTEELIRRNYRHGLSQSDLWIKYYQMKARCFHTKEDHYDRYGGRGITVCKKWLGKDGFLNFVKWAKENGYKKGLSLDRKNNDGNYEPSNCRWITFRYQCFNRNNTIYINGESVAKKAYENGLNLKTVYRRIEMGWSEDRLFIPSTRPKKVVNV